MQPIQFKDYAITSHNRSNRSSESKQHRHAYRRQQRDSRCWLSTDE